MVNKTTEEYGYKLVFTPVTSGSKENEEFFKWTPSGRLEIGTVNQKAADELRTGFDYYLDITRADNGNQE